MKKIITFTFLLLLLSILTSCANSYESMIVKFNKEKFTPEPHKEQDHSVEESGFDQSSMLDSRYLLKDGYEVTLTAPFDGESYKWEVITKEENRYAPEGFIERRKTVCDKQQYTFLPGNDYKIGTENKLVLTVTDKEGTEYIDTAIIIITSWD